MTRSELLRTMSTAELIDWIAFFKLEQADQQRQMEDAQDKAEAQRVARRMAGMR